MAQSCFNMEVRLTGVLCFFAVWSLSAASPRTYDAEILYYPCLGQKLCALLCVKEPIFFSKEGDHVCRVLHAKMHELCALLPRDEQGLFLPQRKWSYRVKYGEPSPKIQHCFELLAEYLATDECACLSGAWKPITAQSVRSLFYPKGCIRRWSVVEKGCVKRSLRENRVYVVFPQEDFALKGVLWLNTDVFSTAVQPEPDQGVELCQKPRGSDACALFVSNSAPRSDVRGEVGAKPKA